MSKNIVDKSICKVIPDNFMPYAMMVILERALPSIDGFKISHRRALYTMYKMGLLEKDKVKCANIVGQTLKIHPHGDSSVYDTIVRLGQADTLLTRYVEPKGNFGQHTSKELQAAHYRYTSANLNPICREVFKDINKSIDFIPTYDNCGEEPPLLPTTFPNILFNVNKGIAVGMASNICSFNLKELCGATKAYIKNKNINLLEYLLAPDFATGGEYLYDKNELLKIYNTGKGNIKLRARYRYYKKDNSIEIYEIPYGTTREAIKDSIKKLIKDGVITGIKDCRDDTDKKGMAITIDLKRGVDVERLMLELYKKTPLEDTFSCNFNILIDGKPRIMGIKKILDEWLKFRRECISKSIKNDIVKLKKQLVLTEGFVKIENHIQEIIDYIRTSSSETEIINKLKEKYCLNDTQAENIANCQIKNFNKTYIKNRKKDVVRLKQTIDRLNDILKDGLNEVIIKDLDKVSSIHGSPRKTKIVKDYKEFKEEIFIDDYNVVFYFTKEGYFKKVPAISLRGATKQTLKDGDIVINEIEGTNKDDVLFFSNKGNVYRLRAYELDDMKTSDIGLFVHVKFGLKEDENIVNMIIPKYKEDNYILIAYSNGYIAKVTTDSYDSNYSTLKGRTGVIGARQIQDDIDIFMVSKRDRGLLINTAEINPVTSRTAKGVRCIKNDMRLICFGANKIKNAEKFRGNRDRVGIKIN